jgi:hypothetical protein
MQRLVGAKLFLHTYHHCTVFRLRRFQHPEPNRFAPCPVLPQTPPEGGKELY